MTEDRVIEDKKTNLVKLIASQDNTFFESAPLEYCDELFSMTRDALIRLFPVKTEIRPETLVWFTPYFLFDDEGIMKFNVPSYDEARLAIANKRNNP